MYPESHWNYRVVKVNDPHKVTKDGCYFMIKEVYYTNELPHSCTVDAVGLVGESKEELKETLKRMLDCLEKDVLNNEYFENWDAQEFSIYDAAKYLNVTNAYVRTLIKTGELHSKDVNGHPVISGHELSAFKDKNNIEAEDLLDEIVATNQDLGLYDVSPEENPLIKKYPPDTD